MFGRIAPRYDLANVLLSGGMDRFWRRALVRRVRQCRPADVLDLATGSGDVAFAMTRTLPRSTEITGMDFCQPMLDQAELKKSAAGTRYPNVQFQLGDGMAIPRSNDSVDVVTIAFGLRNLADRRRGLREMQRVLRPGGTLFVLEFSQPYRWFQPIYYFYLRHILPALAGILTGDRQAYVYLNDTIGDFPPASALAAEIQELGFRAVKAHRMTLGIVAIHEGQK